MIAKNDNDCKMKIAKIEGIVKDANSTIDRKEEELKKLGVTVKDAMDMIAKKDEELKNVKAILSDTNTTLAKKDDELKKLGLSLIEATADLKKVNDEISLFLKVQGKYLYEWKGGDNGIVFVVPKSNNSYEISKGDGSQFNHFQTPVNILNLTVDNSLSCSISQLKGFAEDIGPAVIKNGIVVSMGTKNGYMFFKRI